MRRPVAAVLAATLAIGQFATPTLATDSAREFRHASGIQLVEPDVQQAQPKGENQTLAWNAAYQFMIDHPEDVSYPWVDRATGELLISGKGEQGRALLGLLSATLASAPHKLRQVSLSYADLQGVSTQVIQLAKDNVPGSEFMVRISPDEENNRKVVILTQMHDGLLFELADRLGTSAIAAAIDPHAAAMSPSARDSDASPFYGGAKLESPGCSVAFSWTNGSVWKGMLTAAHCIPSGGNVATPADPMGSVTAGSRENWVTGNGTVPYTGQTMLRGDVALVQLWIGNDAHARMWRGLAGSNTSSIVRLVWQRWSKQGDTYCTSAWHGEICGYVVDDPGTDIRYVDGTWARNVVKGHKNAGDCPTFGDSGGAVFTPYSDGVAAKGVHSGHGDFFWACDEIFTDIQHPIQALPGGVVSSP